MAGGYDDEVNRDFGLTGKPELILLDPNAWKAVGKTRGFKNTAPISQMECFDEPWVYQWHLFIDALADGKTIEESLGEINKDSN